MGTEKILVVDERCRITLGTKVVAPGERFLVSRKPDGTVVLEPVRIEKW